MWTKDELRDRFRNGNDGDHTEPEIEETDQEPETEPDAPRRPKSEWWITQIWKKNNPGFTEEALNQFIDTI